MTPGAGLGLVLIAFGCMVIFCMYMNFDFMFTSKTPGDQKFKALVEAIGCEPVRIIFGLLGVLLVSVGLLGASGSVELIKPKKESGGIQSVGQVLDFSSRTTPHSFLRECEDGLSSGSLSL